MMKRNPFSPSRNKSKRLGKVDEELANAWKKIPETLRLMGEETNRSRAGMASFVKAHLPQRKHGKSASKASDPSLVATESNEIQEEVPDNVPASKTKEDVLFPFNSNLAVAMIFAALVVAMTMAEHDSLKYVPWKIIGPWLFFVFITGFFVGRRVESFGQEAAKMQEPLNRKEAFENVHRRVTMTGEYHPPSRFTSRFLTAPASRTGKMFHHIVDPVLSVPFSLRKNLRRRHESDDALEDRNNIPSESEASVALIPLPSDAVQTLENYTKLPQALKTRGMDIFFNGGEPVSKVSEHPAFQELRKESPLLIVNGMTHIANVILYFQLPDWVTSFSDLASLKFPDDAASASLLQFLVGSDEYRDERVVIVPHLVDAPLPVKVIAPAESEILIKCQSVPSCWHQVEASDDGTLKPALELELDMIASRAIRSVVGIVSRHLHRISLDLACLIYDRPQELSTCLSCFCFDHLDMLSCPSFPVGIDGPETRQDEGPKQ